MAATGIFISYRRSDLPFAAGRLGDALAREFGADRIFRDIDDIEPGADFTEVLHGALSASAVLLVLIGKDWLHTPGDGGRRLDEPGDWVRREIASALARDVRVIPVLLAAAPMPTEAELPADLKPLCRRQAVTLSDASWSQDVARLIDTLRRVLPEPAAVVAVPVPDPAALGARVSADAAASAPGAAPGSVDATARASNLPPAVAELASRVGAEASKWARRLMMVGLGLGAVVVVLTALLVRACNADTPDVSGLWFSDAGAPHDFQRQADVDGERRYAVDAIQADFSRWACDAKPGFFASIEMDCRVMQGDVVAERLRCENLQVATAPAAISGSCTSDRDGRTLKLQLRRPPA